MPPKYTYDAALVRVVDGDTVILRVDLGFRVLYDVEVRLDGINTPEITGPGKAKGLKAKAALETYLAEGPLTVQTFRTEKYGRWLGIVRVAPPGKEPYAVNERLLLEKLAQPYHGTGAKPE